MGSIKGWGMTFIITSMGMTLASLCSTISVSIDLKLNVCEKNTNFCKLKLPFKHIEHEMSKQCPLLFQTNLTTFTPNLTALRPLITCILSTWRQKSFKMTCSRASFAGTSRCQTPAYPQWYIPGMLSKPWAWILTFQILSWKRSMQIIFRVS